MRVLLLNDALSNGGLERQLALLAEGLPPAWQRRVCAFGGGPFETLLQGRGIPVEVIRRRTRLDLTPAPALWRSILASRPDVVHSFGWMTSAAAGPLCRLMGVPLIDGSIRTGSRALMSDHLALRRLGMACATTVVANSRAGLKARNVPPAKGAVVYNGFDWCRLPPEGESPDSGDAGRRPVPDSDDAGRPAPDARAPFTVVMTGRMVPVKDYSTLIHAARLLHLRDAGWRFVLVGDGPDRTKLIGMAAGLVEEGVVEFPEPGLEVLRHVHGADVGVLMTDPALAQEGCSNAILEYMACGLPVVCGEGGGNAEVVVDGETGFLVAPGSAEALADRLVYLREHETERRAMGYAGRRRVKEAFSVEQMVAAFVTIYEQAVSAAKRN